jgi:meiotically up-regulated gene 157 (Mug157) protein
MEKGKNFSLQDAAELIRRSFPEYSRLADMFTNCMRDTLEKTIRIRPDGSVFVITGDIPAMWLRDSACQLRPFILFARSDPKILEILVKLVDRQMECILYDPYANAFNDDGRSFFCMDRTDMKPYLWERKYELDSLCFPVQLSYLIWKNTGCSRQFNQRWLDAVRLILKLFRTEQDHENNSPYTFERENCVYTDTLSRGGKGALVKGNTGLIWSAFRPSDDACAYGYLIPSNMLACVILRNIVRIAEELYRDGGLAKEAGALADEVDAAIRKYACLPGLEEKIFAYEVDGFGQYNVMDDAGLPSLISLPYIGWCEKTDPAYLSTRKWMLSDRNPYYYSGKVLKGIGSPHTPGCYVWPMALCMQGLTAQDPSEKKEILDMLLGSDAGTGMMHEGIDMDDPERYTRPWFSWANSLFCEFLLDLCGVRVEL